MRSRAFLGLAVAVALIAGCSRDPGSNSPGAGRDSDEQAGIPDGYGSLSERWTGDLDGMLERRVVRLLTVASPVHYFVDGAEQGGIVYEAARLFENQLNTDAGTKTLRVHVIVVPVPRDQLIPALLDGRGDVAGGNLTITPERTQQVDFSRPSARDVSEIVVTGPGAPALGAVEDLSGREVFVQPSSGYAESLRGLNAELVAASRKPVEVIAVDEHLEDGDVLEMVQAGLYPITVVDDHMARLWKQLLPGIELHETLAVRRGRELGWAMRKGNPQLKAAVDRFLSSHGQGTRLGNILINRYLANPARLRDPRGKAELARFRDTADTFRKYADRYRFDWLMIMAQAYQESQLDHSKRSPSGAMGIMQIKPSTARDPSVGIAEVSDLDSNVHAGVKYLRVIADSYFADPEVDDRNAMLFAIASYNAGPARIARLRAETPAAGLDPNRWFGNVEVVASRRVGRETVQYVGNIFKYYLAYRMVSERTEKATAARDTPQR